MAKKSSTTGTKKASSKKGTKKKRTRKINPSELVTTDAGKTHVHHLTREAREHKGITDLSNGTAAKLKRGLRERKEAFIRHLSETANVTLSAHLAGWVRRNTAYQHREADPEFRALWEEALEIATDELEIVARQRAIGWDEPIINKDGEIVGQRRVYSDRMMELLLKAHRAKFRDKATVDHTVQGGVVLIPQPLSQEEFEKTAFEQQRPHRTLEHQS